MIPATYYSSIYLFIIMFFTIFQCVVHCNNRFYNKHRITELFLLFFIAVFATTPQKMFNKIEPP